MNKYFSVAGPYVPGEHYMVATQERCRGILGLIDQKQYFVIHAARQSGKTTLLQELTEQIIWRGAIPRAVLLAGKYREDSGIGTGHSGHHGRVGKKRSSGGRRYTRERRFTLWDVKRGG